MPIALLSALSLGSYFVEYLFVIWFVAALYAAAGLVVGLALVNRGPRYVVDGLLAGLAVGVPVLLATMFANVYFSAARG